MPNALHALLTGIIDYAGTFPPANLPLEKALSNYQKCRTEPDSWMLGRFVWPAARLREINASAPLPISSLGRGGNTRPEIVENLRTDLADISAAKGVEVGSFEMRVPPTHWGPDNTRSAAGLFAAVGEMVETASTPSLSVFYEIPVELDPKPLHAFTETLAMSNAIGKMRKVRRMPPAGVKLRCAGPSGQHPSSVEVAQIISACAARQLPMKFTAGLHHPLRHDGGHGFLNVFLAGIFAHTHRLHESDVLDILEIRDAKEFVFSEPEVRWETLAVTVPQIERARRDFVTSFGSCSFDEPRDGLRALKLLP